MTVSSVAPADMRHWTSRLAVRVRDVFAHLLRPARGAAPKIVTPAFLYMIGAAVTLIVLSMLLFDVRAIVGARALPRWVKDIFHFITDFGTSGTWLYPLGALMIGLALAPPGLPKPVLAMIAAIMARAGFIFTAIALPALFATLVKRVIGRARPFVGGSANAFLYQPLEWNPPAYASLPSGHATGAVAAAVAIGLLWPRTRVVMGIYAILICISRVVVGAHYPSDVLAGALVGVIGVILVRRYFASRRLVFGVDAQGEAVPFPGPSRKRVKSVARAMLAE